MGWSKRLNIIDGILRYTHLWSWCLDMSGWTMERNGSVIVVNFDFEVIFLFDGKVVRFRDGNGNVRPMRTDTSGTPDMLDIDGMQLVAIERNGKFAVRLRDAQSKMRREFISAYRDHGPCAQLRQRAPLSRAGCRQAEACGDRWERPTFVGLPSQKAHEDGPFTEVAAGFSPTALPGRSDLRPAAA